jgi:hypothetical protein
MYGYNELFSNDIQKYLTFVVPELRLLIMRGQIQVFVILLICHLGSIYITHTLLKEDTCQSDSCHLDLTSFAWSTNVVILM